MSQTKVIPIAEPKEAQPIEFPIYRKYKTGTEWQKIASPSCVLHITHAGSWWSITFDTANMDLIADALQDPELELCTRDEWEKIYSHAQWTLTQINGVYSHKKLPPIRSDDPICDQCGGSGEGRGPGSSCSTCHGLGHRKQKKEVDP